MCKLTIISYRIEVLFNESIWIGSLLTKSNPKKKSYLNIFPKLMDTDTN